MLRLQKPQLQYWGTTNACYLLLVHHCGVPYRCGRPNSMAAGRICVRERKIVDDEEEKEEEEEDEEEAKAAAYSKVRVRAILCVSSPAGFF